MNIFNINNFYETFQFSPINILLSIFNIRQIFAESFIYKHNV